MHNFLLSLCSPRPHHAAWYALFAGGLAVLGLPSGPTPLALIAGLMIFIRLLPSLSSRRGAWLGFLFGLSYFSFGFSWLLTSLHVYGGISLPLALAMLLGLSAIMALYPALFGALLPRLIPDDPDPIRQKRHYWLLPLAAPALWTLTEWLRSHVLGGFAWNLVGYGWERWLPMIQVADFGGVFFLSWLLVFSASILAVLWLRGACWRESMIVCTMLGTVLALVYLYGLWRVQDLTSHPETDIAPIQVAVVQGNIPQQLKWSMDHRDKTVAHYIALSQNIPKHLDLVVWPETAMAFFLQASPEHLRQISTLSETIDAPILTGVPRIDRAEDGHYLYFNSVVLLDKTGSFAHRYDKHHLVPFGEFIPFRAFVPSSFKKFTEGTEDFSTGPGPIALPWSKGAIGPLICYEAIFPDEVRMLVSTGARWLVNVTNDGWFGESAKPQHLAMVRLRSIENRLPLIRAANTGISAVFDQVGQMLGHIAADQEGTLVVTLPAGRGHSFYQRYGDVWIGVWVGLSLLSGLIKMQYGHPKQ